MCCNLIRPLICAAYREAVSLTTNLKTSLVASADGWSELDVFAVASSLLAGR